jgi:uncharacterized membrane protein YfcA
VIPTFFLLSAIGGFFSGLLGVGGAVILIPLLRSVPPLFGVGELTMAQVSGITMIQVLAASIVGFLGHRRGGTAHTHTILTIGIPMGICALFGATLSKTLSDRAMLVLFGILVAIAFALLLKKAPGEGKDEADDHFAFNAPLSVAVGSSVGLVSGILGAGGGFIIISLMIRVLRIPMRIAVGSSLGIVFIGATMGSIGKITSGQVEWGCLIPVLCGSIPAALLGVRVNRKLPAAHVRYVLLGVVLLVLIKTWIKILWTG